MRAFRRESLAVDCAPGNLIAARLALISAEQVLLSAGPTVRGDFVSDPAEARWLLLIHQIPPQPSNFRVRIWRRLQKLGAVAIKNSVYVLPASDQAQEDFEWVLREIQEGGGDVTLCEARLIDGLTDDEVVGLFRAARDADYDEIGQEIEELLVLAPLGAQIPTDVRADLEAKIPRLKRRFGEVAAIDFLGAPGRQVVGERLADMEARIRFMGTSEAGPRATLRPEELRGRTWVTRRGIQVDLIGSAWLIRRFIDPGARFKFVPGNGYPPEPGELRFDMFEGEFTHEGDRCTFEVLVERLGLDDPALRVVAEIVHDVHLKDEKFGRLERVGVERLILGLTSAHARDEDRLARGGALFDDLYQAFRTQAGP